MLKAPSRRLSLPLWSSARVVQAVKEQLRREGCIRLGLCSRSSLVSRHRHRRGRRSVFAQRAICITHRPCCAAVRCAQLHCPPQLTPSQRVRRHVHQFHHRYHDPHNSLSRSLKKVMLILLTHGTKVTVLYLRYFHCRLTRPQRLQFLSSQWDATMTLDTRPLLPSLCPHHLYLSVSLQCSHPVIRQRTLGTVRRGTTLHAKSIEHPFQRSMSKRLA